MRHFPHPNEKARILETQLQNFLIASYQFSHDEYNALVETATHFLFNYTLRPVWTIIEFLFEKPAARRDAAPAPSPVPEHRETIPQPSTEIAELPAVMVKQSDIESKVAYLHSYRYLRNALLLHLDATGTMEISKEETDRFLRRVDHEVVARHNAGELVRLLSPAFSLFNFGQGKQLRSAIPTNAFVVFFDDKGRPDVRAHFETVRDAQGRPILSPAELYAELVKSFPPAAIQADPTPHTS